MAIDTSTVVSTVWGDLRVLVQKHATPGTGANDVDTGMSYLFGVVGNVSTTADKVLCLTPNTSDHSTEANGHFTLESEHDATCYTIAVGK